MRLQAEGGAPFPFALGSPVRAAVLDGALHVVAAEASGEAAYHVAIDAGGNPGPATPVPLVPTGLAACGGRLVVTGLSRADSRAKAVLLDPSGALLSELELPVRGAPSRWPVPLCLGGGARIYWETTDPEGAASTLEWIDLAGSTGSLAWPDRTADLAAAAMGGDMLLLRLHGQPPKAELLRLAGGAIVQSTAVEGPALAQLVAAGSRIGVPIATLRELRLAWFDGDLHLADPPEPVLAVAEPETLRSALLVPMGPEAILVGYSFHAAAGDRLVEMPGSRFEPAEPRADERIVLYDVRDHSLEPVELDGGLLAAAWLGDRLVIVSGGRLARISRLKR